MKAASTTNSLSCSSILLPIKKKEIAETLLGSNKRTWTHAFVFLPLLLHLLARAVPVNCCRVCVVACVRERERERVTWRVRERERERERERK